MKKILKKRKNYDKPWQVPLYTKPKDQKNNNIQNKNNKKGSINDKTLKKNRKKAHF